MVDVLGFAGQVVFGTAPVNRGAVGGRKPVKAAYHQNSCRHTQVPSWPASEAQESFSLVSGPCPLVSCSAWPLAHVAAGHGEQTLWLPAPR